MTKRYKTQNVFDLLLYIIFKLSKLWLMNLTWSGTNRDIYVCRRVDIDNKDVSDSRAWYHHYHVIFMSYIYIYYIFGKTLPASLNYYKIYNIF
jgi:hypothetical protein